MSTTLKMRYPVHTPDGQEILQAGAYLTTEVMDNIIDSGETNDWPEISISSYGTICSDLQAYIRQDPYHMIFGRQDEYTVLHNLMENVRMPLPVLKGLDYFKENDYYTYRHILMVFALSCVLAMDLRKKDADIIKEANAGPLHDFGKICVPLRVLKKRTPLLRSEVELLQEHSASGFVLLSYYLKDYRKFSPRVARDHHELKDGSGYPRGIHLNDNLVEIVTACDMYDALISLRPYREGPFDNRTALEEITKAAEENKISWEIVKILIARNRKDKPQPEECHVSLEKRGIPPEGNLYGMVIEDEDEPKQQK